MVAFDDRRPLGVWENEGGSRAAPTPDSATPARGHRYPPQDTAEGCDAMAAADMARAAKEAPGWARVRYEHSAVMWSRRAEWLRPIGKRPRA